MERTRKRVAIAALVLLVAACGGPDDSQPSTNDGKDGFSDNLTGVVPLIVNSEIVVGKNRLLVGLLNENDDPVADPEVDMDVRFFELDGNKATFVSEESFDFVWSVEPVVGYWVGDGSFDHAGRWGAEVAVSGGGLDEAVRTSFNVKSEPVTPGLGEKVPASDTLTSNDVDDLTAISTDDHPNPRFYETSIAEAVQRGIPFVVTFATPKYCTSQVCGPTLDIVKGVARDFPKITFIHVEPFRLPLKDPSERRPVKAYIDWNLPSEPWVFVVNGEGRVTAKYEGALAPEELTQELQKL